MEARWERSPRKRNMFIVGGACGRVEDGTVAIAYIPAPDV